MAEFTFLPVERMFCVLSICVDILLNDNKFERIEAVINRGEEDGK